MFSGVSFCSIYKRSAGLCILVVLEYQQRCEKLNLLYFTSKKIIFPVYVVLPLKLLSPPPRLAIFSICLNFFEKLKHSIWKHV